MRAHLRLLMALLCATVLLGAPAATPPAGVAGIAKLENPDTGTPRDVANWTLALGKGTLRLAMGRALPLLDGDRQVGFYFEGTGVFSLPIDQLDEIPVARLNLERNTKAKFRLAGETWFLDLPVRELNLFYEGLELPPFGAEAAPAAEDLLRSRGGFREKYLMPGWRARSHVMLTARHNAPAQAAWYLSLVGDLGLWEFVRDPWTSRTEQLWFARDRSIREGKQAVDALVMAPISVRRLDAQPRSPLVPPFLLRHLDLDLEARADGTCRYVATETFIPQQAGMKMMSLLLADTLFDRKNGHLIPHRLNLRKVTLDDQEVPFDHRENELLLELPAPAQAGQPLRLRFEVDGDFLIHPQGDNRWELGNEPWFPSTVMEGMLVQGTARIRSEKPFFPMASGRITSRREEGNLHILETKVDQPTWAFFIVAGNYFMEEEVRNGVTVRVANYAHKPGPDGVKLLRLAHGIIEFYEALLGPLPVRELTVVQRNDWGAGQAPAGFLFMSNEAFNPLVGTLNQWFSRGVNQRFAHEIAHQYWGNQVLVASSEEDWISESFSQYCSALLMRRAKGEGEFKRLMAEWESQTRRQAEWGTIPTSYRIQDLDDPFRGFQIRHALTYGKGAVLLNRIHTEIGDQAFATLLRSYLKSLKGRPGTTKDLINLIKIISKRDYTTFFEQYLWMTAMPS